MLCSYDLSHKKVHASVLHWAIFPHYLFNKKTKRYEVFFLHDRRPTFPHGSL